jgi:hypothetical protein
MQFQDLPGLLRNAGIPEDAYVLDGGPGSGECWGLMQDGSNWQLYYSERGRKSPRGMFSSEDAACRAMVQALTGTPLPIPHETL